MWQRKPTGGRALKGVTTAVSPSVLALRSEQRRDIYPCVAIQPEKGRTTLSSARTKPGQGCQEGAHHTSTQHGKTWGSNLNPAITHSFVEVVRGAAPRSGLPTIKKGTQHAQQRRIAEGRGGT